MESDLEIVGGFIHSRIAIRWIELAQRERRVQYSVSSEVKVVLQ